MSKWQPIATAPIDGTRILAATTSTRVFVAHWMELQSAWGNDASWEVAYQPTHWMPLPQPPVSGEKSK